MNASPAPWGHTRFSRARFDLMARNWSPCPALKSPSNRFALDSKASSSHYCQSHRLVCLRDYGRVILTVKLLS
jgi:hypothetical protein